MVFLYKATLHRVVSPVTLSVNLDLGFNLVKTQLIRLNGVSMPATSEAKAKAVAIIDDWLNRHPIFVVHTLQSREPFGRFFGTVYSRWGTSLNRKLVRAGVAQEIPDAEIPTDEPEEDLDSVICEVVSDDELPEIVQEPEDEPEEDREPEIDEDELVAEDDESDGTDALKDSMASEVQDFGEQELTGEPEDLLEEMDEAELIDEIREELPRRRRWRLKSADRGAKTQVPEGDPHEADPISAEAETP